MRYKKILVSALLAALLVLAILPVSALAATGDYHIESPWVGQELADGTVELVAYTGGTISGNMVVPDTIDGFAVTGIDSSVFVGKTGLTGITIPEGVTYIDGGAFSGDTGLINVSLPSTLKTIGNNCFCGCSALETIALPSALETIDTQAFNTCSNLTTVTMGNNVTTFGLGAFVNCTKLSSINLSTGLTTIGQCAFQNTAVQTVTIPASLTSIGTYAFYQSGLTSIDIPATVQTIGEAAFGNSASLSSVTFHEGLLTIGPAAFANTGLTEVTIPSSVTSIGSGAFMNCSSMAKATILSETVTLNGGSFTPPISDGMYGFDGSTAQSYYPTYGFTFHIIYKISYDSKGGSAVDWDYNVSGGTVDEPDAPTRDGFVFAGWYDNDDYVGDAVSFPYTITGSATLYAKWVTPYTVMFQSNGGSAVAEQTVGEGLKVTEPDNPARDGHVFGGWYEDEALSDAWDFDADTVFGNTTLYAKWTALTLKSSDADGKIYTDGRVTLTPSVDGGEWDWDEEYLSATFNSPATFTGLKAGTTTVIYTVDGVSATYDVTIEESELPSTGQGFTWVWALCAAAFIVLSGAVWLFLRRKKDAFDAA